MQENNFERDVRQKLEELHLTPSEPVWHRVEAAIQKKRKRRLVLWLLPLLTAGGLMWWQTSAWQTGTDSHGAGHRVRQEPTFSKPHTETSNRETEIQPTEQSKQRPSTHTNLAGDQAHRNIRPSVQGTHKTDALVNRKTNYSVTRNAVDVRSTNSRTNSGNDAQLNAAPAVSKKALLSDVQAAMIAGTSIDAPVVDTLRKAPIIEKDSLQKTEPPIQVHKKTKWKWNVAGRVGASNLHEGLFSRSSNKSFQSEAVQLDNTSGQSCLPCITNGNYSFKSTAVPVGGLQFSIGASAKKWLYRNTYFTAGLGYGFYSYHLLVGSELPSTSVSSGTLTGVRKMYRNNGPQENFKNTFHFVELPVGLEHQLARKRPLHLQYGVTMQQTIASRALQFNSQTNTYYQTTQGVRKTGFGLFASMNYTVWKNAGVSLQAGPHLQYGLRNLFRNTSGTRLVSGGVAVHMAF